jgi:5-methyltetrahydrofolate--homocysteine methyltransferase
VAMSREEEIRAGLFDHTLNGHAPEVKALTEEGLSLGMDPMDILFKALIPSLEEVGRRFEKGDFFVPEMLIAARAMQGALVILRPLIAETGAKPVGRYVIGTVKGDIHDIGKNLCVIMLEGAGFEVFDLGVNTPPEKFVAAIEQHQPDVIGFSAFLTTTMPMFKVNIDAITKAGLRDKVHIAVGGAPVTQEYAKHVGADSYAPDASMATRMAKEIVGDRSGSSQGAQALEQAVKLIDETLKKG